MRHPNSSSDFSSGPHAGEISGPPALDPEVGDGPQGVIEAVGEVGGANHQGQFHDLARVVILAQLLERAAANARGTAGEPLGVEDGGLLLVIKERAAFIELQGLDLLLRDADSLRRSDMGAASIFTAVDQRGLQVGQLLEARLDGALVHHGAV